MNRYKIKDKQSNLINQEKFKSKLINKVQLSVKTKNILKLLKQQAIKD